MPQAMLAPPEGSARGRIISDHAERCGSGTNEHGGHAAATFLPGCCQEIPVISACCWNAGGGPRSRSAPTVVQHGNGAKRGIPMTDNMLREVPTVDARVEFWSDLGRWPRETITHTFLAWVVLDLGSLLFPDHWIGDEPAAELVQPIWPRHDTSTPEADVQRAALILYHSHPGYRQRADRDLADRPWSVPPVLGSRTDRVQSVFDCCRNASQPVRDGHRLRCRSAQSGGADDANTAGELAQRMLSELVFDLPSRSRDALYSRSGAKRW